MICYIIKDSFKEKVEKREKGGRVIFSLFLFKVFDKILVIYYINSVNNKNLEKILRDNIIEIKGE